MLAVYSSLLLVMLGVGSPYWLVRMASSGRYRAGLSGRLGRVPAALRRMAAGRDVVWVHAVSVGEVMAATRLVGEMEAALPGWVVMISTTTATGQALARERFGQDRVFFYPLDLGWAVRNYLKALRPRLLVLMESEMWPRMLVECGRAGVPVAVVNARVSDQSFARAVRVRGLWGRVLRRVELFAAQSEEDARRLRAMGAREERVKVAGNLKYDVRAPGQNGVAKLVREIAARRPVVVAGSTVGRLGDSALSEEEIVIEAWAGGIRELGAMLVLAPRHPERFAEVEGVAREFRFAKASEWVGAKAGSSSAIAGGETTEKIASNLARAGVEVFLLDTIGDLAAVYGIADVAFVGGSLVAKGGHNPLEPAQFGVPVMMGASYENFRDVVGRMREAGGIRMVKDGDELGATVMELLENRELAVAMGERGRAVFQSQAGATGKTVEMLMALLRERARGTDERVMQ